MPPRRNARRANNNNNNNQNITEIIMSLIPDIANQIAAAMNNNNVNNDNNNNQGNNNNRYSYQQSMTCETKKFDTIRITRWTERVETTIDISNGTEDDKGALIDEMARKGKSTKDSEKRKDDAESSRQGNNKKARTNKNNYGGKPYAGSAPKCNKCNLHHHQGVQCRVCYECRKLGHLGKDCRSKAKATEPINAYKPKSCYECGSTEHLRNTCPKLNKNGGNNVAQPRITNGNQGPGNQGNRGNNAKPRLYVMGANPDQMTVADAFGTSP
jgi:hypothetical protein